LGIVLFGYFLRRFKKQQRIKDFRKETKMIVADYEKYNKDEHGCEICGFWEGDKVSYLMRYWNDGSLKYIECRSCSGRVEYKKSFEDKETEVRSTDSRISQAYREQLLLSLSIISDNVYKQGKRRSCRNELFTAWSKPGDLDSFSIEYVDYITQRTREALKTGVRNYDEHHAIDIARMLQKPKRLYKPFWAIVNRNILMEGDERFAWRFCFKIESKTNS
jgi:hypothetical protein